MDKQQSNSGITSTFQFINYKIDKIDFSMTPMTANIICPKEQVSVDFGLAFPNVQKMQENNGKTSYIARLEAKVTLLNNDEPLAQGIFAISGMFVTENAFEEETEQNLIRIQAPAILFPYLRAAITNILASSGFDTVILPLVNVQAVAKNVQIEIENLK